MLIVLSICGWLVCGILSPITWILANGDLKRMAEGAMDSSGSGTTQTAKVIAMVHCILMIVSVVIVVIAFVFFAAFGFVAVQDANQAAAGAAESAVVEIGQAEQLSRIIGDLGNAVNQQMQEGRQLASPVKIDGANQPDDESPETSVVAFEYSFPIVINGLRKENLSRHEGTFNYRGGQWHLDQVAVSFKFFDTDEFSPPVDLLVEPVEDTPGFQSLKTMWLQTVEKSVAAMTLEQNRKKAELQKQAAKDAGTTASKESSDAPQAAGKRPSEEDYDGAKLGAKKLTFWIAFKLRFKKEKLDKLSSLSVSVRPLKDVEVKWSKALGVLTAKIPLETPYSDVYLHFVQKDNREETFDPWTLVEIDTTGKKTNDYYPKLEKKLREAFAMPLLTKK
jgi:hypothetical protein